MSFDLTTGSIKSSFTAPSSTVSNPTIRAVIERSTFDAEADATAFYALWSSFDVTKCRVCADDETTELAFDVVDYDLTVGSEYLDICVGWVGDILSTDTPEFYLMPALSGNASYGVDDTYGRGNAYDSSVELAALSGGGDDRSTNQLSSTAYGGAVSGDADGIVGKATSYDGSTTYFDYGSDDLDLTYPLTFRAWVKPDGTGDYDAIIARRSFSAGYQYQWRSLSSSYNILTSGGAVGSGLSVVDDAWQYTAVSIDDSGNILFFVNGESYTGSSQTITSKETSTTVGRGEASSSSHTWSGLIGSLCADSTARSLDYLAYEYLMGVDNASFVGTVTYNSPDSGSSGVLDDVTMVSLTVGVLSGNISVSGSLDDVVLSAMAIDNITGSVGVAGSLTDIDLSAISLDSISGVSASGGILDDIMLSSPQIGSVIGSITVGGKLDSLVLSAISLDSIDGSTTVSAGIGDISLSSAVVASISSASNFVSGSLSLSLTSSSAKTVITATVPCVKITIN